MADGDAKILAQSFLEKLLSHGSPLAPDPRKRVPRVPNVEVPDAWLRTSTSAARERIQIRPNDNDLTNQRDGEPFGQRIYLEGRAVDGKGVPVPGVILEIWQANSSGTYIDPVDPLEVPVDPNFIGIGRTVTDEHGVYSFTTIRPAAYPGPEGSGIPFRPAHIHFSVIGPDLNMRLITQVYFEGDPLIQNDFVVGGMRRPEERSALIAKYDDTLTVHFGPKRVLGYRWDIVLDGPDATPWED